MPDTSPAGDTSQPPQASLADELKASLRRAGHTSQNGEPALTPGCQWKRSSFHVDTNRGDCPEVRQYGDRVIGVRDARNPHKLALLFDPATWAAFVAGIKAGEFDLAGGQ